MDRERLKKQIDFIVEIDKLKGIFRQSYIVDGSRKENDAEHSWHLAVMAFMLSEYYGGDALDIQKVMKMVLVHDLVEIYAGDTYCYDEKDYEDKCEREKAAADTLFGMLPEDQCKEFMELWREFEDCNTDEAHFAAVLDRLQPLLLNYNAKGKSWIEHNIHKDQVLQRNSMVLKKEGPVHDFVLDMIEEAVAKGYLKSN